MWVRNSTHCTLGCSSQCILGELGRARGSDLVVRLLLPGRGIERPLWNDGMHADIGVHNLGDSKVDHAAGNRDINGSKP